MDVAVAVHTKNQFYPTNLVVSAPLREDTKRAEHAKGIVILIHIV
jgi:hypothetical protein